MSLGDVVFNIALAFAGVVFALWYENLGAARLMISVDSTTDEDALKRGRRFLYLNIANVPRRKIPFVTRQTAYSCRGKINFFTLDQKQIGGDMKIRWNDSPEPLEPELVEVAGGGKELAHLPDFRFARFTHYIDISPGETEGFAVAMRVGGEANAFGFTTESYRYRLRHPDYVLEPGEFVARISLWTGDDVVRQDFHFINPEAFEKFDWIIPDPDPRNIFMRIVDHLRYFKPLRG